MCLDGHACAHGGGAPGDHYPGVQGDGGGAGGHHCLVARAARRAGGAGWCLLRAPPTAARAAACCSPQLATAPARSATRLRRRPMQRCSLRRRGARSNRHARPSTRPRRYQRAAPPGYGRWKAEAAARCRANAPSHCLARLACRPGCLRWHRRRRRRSCAPRARRGPAAPEPARPRCRGQTQATTLLALAQQWPPRLRGRSAAGPRT
mmetsp:Transcript_16563/g.49436  ORF Transcript_16563/g.49436 Transcript_16563/m.49436 type:complete len:207 (-) Transcript_16563:53-673(-)